MPAAPINLNVRNFSKWRGRSPEHFPGIRFDSNNDCNIHCVYCHIERSDGRIDLEEFREFLRETVVGAEMFQFGCQMEPTLDERLLDFIESVRDFAKPKREFRLQTNGILLHRHDPARMREAGLNFLTVSMDSVDPEATKELRGGTSLKKVLRNVEAFRRACPEVRVVFVTTVTARNIGVIKPLVQAGIDLGVSIFNLRQVAYEKKNTIVDHSRMLELVVSDEAFDAMVASVKAEFANRTHFSIQGRSVLHEGAMRTRAASDVGSASGDL